MRRDLLIKEVTQSLTKRRTVLRSLGAAGVAALAGCVSDDDDNEPTDTESPATDTDDGDLGEGSPTETPTGEPVAVFTVDSIEPVHAELDRGEPITASATITNTGGTSGTQDVSFQIDGETIDSTELTLGHGESESISVKDIETDDREFGWYEYAFVTADDRFEGWLGVIPTEGFEKLRHRFIWNRATSEGLVDHEEDEAVQTILDGLDGMVDDFLSEKLTTDDTDRVWTDLPLGPGNDQSDRPQHYLDISLARFKALAAAYHMPTSDWKDDPEVISAAKNGLESLSEYYYPDTNQYGGWYDWQIGMTEQASYTIVCMKDQLPQSIIDHYWETVSDHTPMPSLDKGSGDLAKMAMTWIRLGIVAEDEELIQVRGVDRLGDTLEFDDENNIKPDGSAIDHGIHPYNAHYQAKFLGEITKIGRLVQGTPWSLSNVFPQKIYNLYRMARQVWDPVVWRGQPMVMVMGRFQHGARKKSEGRRILTGFLRLGEFAPQSYADYFNARAKEWIERNSTDEVLEESKYTLGDTMSNSLTKYALGSRVMNDESIDAAPPLERYKQYYNMDRAVHHETTHGTYALGLAMYSKRIGNYEALSSGAGPKHAWFTSYGMTYFYTENLSHFRDGYFQTVDPERPPGTTTNPAATTDISPNTIGRTSHAGGVEFDGRFGTSGMVLIDAGDRDKLRAHKSWFCFGDAVVCLGSGITGDGRDRQIATTVANRTLGKTDTGTIRINGEEVAESALSEEDHASVNWAHLEHSPEAFGKEYSESFGYVFPGGSSVKVVREANSTEDSSVGIDRHYGTDWAEEPPYTRYYAKFMLEHGTNPDSAGYAYAVLPDTGVATTEEYASDPPFEILKHSEAVHAVTHSEHSLTALQSFDAASVDDPGISVDGPASVMYEEGEQELTVAVADPTLERESIEVELPFSDLEPVDVTGKLTVTETDPLTTVVNTGEISDLRKGQTIKGSFAF